MTKRKQLLPQFVCLNSSHSIRAQDERFVNEVIAILKNNVKKGKKRDHTYGR